MTSVASHSISSVRPENKAHKSHKERASDGSFEAMLDSALPDAGNDRAGDDGARKAQQNGPAQSASAANDAPASEKPAAKCASAGSDGRDSPDGNSASSKTGAAKQSTKPADAQSDDSVVAGEADPEFALTEDTVDAATDNAADALAVADPAATTAPPADTVTNTAAIQSGTPAAVVVPVQTDVAPATTQPATTDAADIAVKPATVSASGTVTTSGLETKGTETASKTTTQAPSAPQGTAESGKPNAAPTDLGAPVATKSDRSALPSDDQIEAPADPSIPVNAATPKASAPSTDQAAPVATEARSGSTVPGEPARVPATPAPAEAAETETAATPQPGAAKPSDDTTKEAANDTENTQPDEARPERRGAEGAERKADSDAPATRGAPARPAVNNDTSRGSSPSAQTPTEAQAEKGPHAAGTNAAAPEAKGPEAKPAHAHATHVGADLPNAHLSVTDTAAATSAPTTIDPSAIDPTRTPGATAQPLTAGPVTATTTTPNAPYAAAALAPVPVSGLAVEIVAQARDGKSRFEIRLDPPELGRIDVHLHVDRDGTVTSRLVVERSETLDLLKRDAPTLERALQNAGLKTGDQGLEFSLRHHGDGRQQNDGQAPRGSRVVVPDDVQPLNIAGNTYGRRLGVGAGIDIRV